MKIKDELPKTNKELLEHAKLFKFKYGRKIIKIETRYYCDEESWIISCSGMFWNRSSLAFESNYISRAHIFSSVADALKVVNELIK